MSLSKRDIPTSFAEADLRLGPHKLERRIGKNGLLWRDAGTWGTSVARIFLRLHNTDIVTYHADGRMTLRTGGYNTVTTRSWINHALKGNGFRVWQHKGQQYLGQMSGAVVPFWGPGMVVHPASGLMVLA